MKKVFLNIIYRRLASVARKMILRHQPTVIAITGSVGKTSTKEALFCVLGAEHGDDVRATSGNLNAEIGLPLTILGYKEQPKKWQWPGFLIGLSKHLAETKFPKYLILEMGVDKPGDIDYFCQIVKPNFAIITAATPAHVENFSSVRQMQEEKIKLTKYVDGKNLFYNSDDDFLAQNIASGVAYSIDDKKAEIRAIDCRISDQGNSYKLVAADETAQISNKLLGKHLIYCDLAAAAVALRLGVSFEKVVSSLKKRNPYQGRMNLLDGIDDTKIIDDTYNANPASVLAAISTLQELHSTGRKVIVLGNMNELGQSSRAEHLKVASRIPEEIEVVVFVGPHAQAMRDSLGRVNDTYSFSNRSLAEDAIRGIIKNGDTILVKASQNKNYFEELVKILLKPGIDPKKVLVRQGSAWLGKKNIF